MIRRIEAIRGIIKSVTATASKLMRFDASGRTDEDIENREVMQQYGFGSRPKDGAECLVIKDGNHFLMIASDDRRYRIGLQEGEVALYTDEGDSIHLKRGKTIEVKSGGTVDINATGKVLVKAPSVKMGQGVVIDTAAGVVTTQCICSVTGAVHPQGSVSVKATLS